jgi:hypothetical protein
MYKRILAVTLFVAPAFAFAQNNVQGPLGNTLSQVDAVLKFFLGIAMPLAIAFFFWGLIKFIKAGDSSDLKKGGKTLMINSGIALFLMVGIWTILGYVQKSVGLQGQVDVSQPPTLNVIPQ